MSCDTLVTPRRKKPSRNPPPKQLAGSTALARCLEPLGHHTGRPGQTLEAVVPPAEQTGRLGVARLSARNGFGLIGVNPAGRWSASGMRKSMEVPQ